jgi:hypothetical protein
VGREHPAATSYHRRASRALRVVPQGTDEETPGDPRRRCRKARWHEPIPWLPVAKRCPICAHPSHHAAVSPWIICEPDSGKHEIQAGHETCQQVIENWEYDSLLEWATPPQGVPIGGTWQQPCAHGAEKRAEKCSACAPAGTCHPCRNLHYEDFSAEGDWVGEEHAHCGNYCQRFACAYSSPTAHTRQECGPCHRRPWCHDYPHCISDSRCYDAPEDSSAPHSLSFVQMRPSGTGPSRSGLAPTRRFEVLRWV